MPRVPDPSFLTPREQKTVICGRQVRPLVFCERSRAHVTHSLLRLLAPEAKEIVQRISKGEWTASEVLEAYISRALLAQDMTNCLTEGLPSSPP